MKTRKFYKEKCEQIANLEEMEKGVEAFSSRSDATCFSIRTRYPGLLGTQHYLIDKKHNARFLELLKQIIEEERKEFAEDENK